ncbi:alpha/beta hydrolase [bacterium]|nr:alpha/beta hydrolase [bacterium]
MSRLEELIAKTRQTLKPLREINRTEPEQAFTEYCRYYGLELPDIRRSYGLINSAGYAIFCQIMQPMKPRGTVFLVHGYLTHSALFRHAVQALCQDHLSLVLFDLPGHGLSSGERGRINDFFEYRQVLSDLVAFCRSHLKGPFFGLGHSTGAAIVLDTLLALPRPPFERSVLVAPLVRNVHWTLTRCWARMISKRLHAFPRRFSRNSSDQAFVHFVRHDDPLQVRQVKTAWLEAMLRWFFELDRKKSCSCPLLVVQGSRDRTVDWRYNLPFIVRKCPAAHQIIIPRASHELLNENPQFRRPALSAIVGFLR